MKNRLPCQPMMALAVMVLCSLLAPVLRAQNTNPAPASTRAAVTASAGEPRPVQLSPGVPEILKLGRARVSDDLIIAFIRNSRATYHLSASEILYLREQGVSEPVLAAMLNARQNAAATTAPAAPQPAPTGPTAESANSSPRPVPVPTQPAPAYDASVYAQPPPVYAYPAPSYYDYYGDWPYYWGYPVFSFGLGYYGGGYYGGYRWGGYHGGYYGGGYHGGGGGHR